MAFETTEHAQHSEQHGQKDRGSGGALKKQRSLSNLFTKVTRKSSRTRSRPPSPSTPVTPKIPDYYLSTTRSTSASPRQSSKGRDSNDELRIQDQEVGTYNASGSRDGNHVEQQHPGRTSSASNTQWDPRVPPKRKAGDGSKELNALPVTPAGSTGRRECVEGSERSKPTLHHSPTAPLLQKRSQRALLERTGQLDTRLRGISATFRGVQSRSPSSPIYPRPATAGEVWFHDSTDGSSNKTGRPPIPRNQWRDPQNMDAARASYRSAGTNTSSLANAASTDRSSVATRQTSVSDQTVEITEGVHPKDGGMTADDAIDLYAAGFADDTDSEQNSNMDSTTDLAEYRRSMRLAEAINDDMGSGLPLPQRPSTATSQSSAAIMSGAACTHDPPGTPSMLPPTSTRDQYGFLKASHYVTSGQYDAWATGYLPTQERRTRKWLSYMGEYNITTHLPTRFPTRSTKTQRYIRKGIPPAWRGPAWFFYAGGETHLQKHPKLYPTLVTRSTTELGTNDKEIIERDLHRTFPDNIHFKPDSPSTTESPLLLSLRNVLRAFSLHSPRIGYCQSLNFIAGLLLIFLPEEKAFWMLHIITTTYLPGTHEISLEGANVDLGVLMTALKDSLPSIWAKISSGDDEAGSLGVKLPPISLCTTSWFMSLFIGTLPIEAVLRVWDVLFYEGSRTLFRIAIAIFKIGEQRIRSVNESMEMFQVVQGLPRGTLDAGNLMNVALRRGGVSQEWVEKRRKERKRWYARERARALGVGAAEEGGETGGDGRPKRAESLWRRRIKS